MEQLSSSIPAQNQLLNYRPEQNNQSLLQASNTQPNGFNRFEKVAPETFVNNFKSIRKMKGVRQTPKVNMKVSLDEDSSLASGISQLMKKQVDDDIPE